MTSKHKGLCPFCKAEVIPRVIQENHVRRDKCECPECKEAIYICRAPGVRITLRVVVCMTMSCVRHVHQVLAAESAH